jgi:hypothetical protein
VIFTLRLIGMRKRERERQWHFVVIEDVECLNKEGLGGGGEEAQKNQ